VNAPPRNPLHTQLLRWYRLHQRSLPWRTDPTPYAVWISEIMLQQTQVVTVIDYFHRWMTRFPNVESLAAAPVDAVLAAWQGLGYYRRARSIHEAAQLITQNGWPQNREQWLSLPGIGPYTAGAICSISLGQPECLVDGNVERVYARLAADNAEGAQLNRRAWEWASRNLEREHPGDWNQALMELGATVCTPTNPRCDACPVAELCVAKQTWQVNQLPTRTARRASVALTHHLWIPRWGEKFGIEQIPVGEWWEGMWSFPRAEDPAELEPRFPDAWPRHVGSLRHSVTHHRILLTVSVIESVDRSLTWVTREEIDRFALPAPHKKALGLALKN
jgi:A/G-specific adenine glycosylase